MEDPLINLTPKNKEGIKFELKTVTHKQILKCLKKMKKKQSAGVDGLSQDKLVLGAKSLVFPLLQIVNQSIREGCFQVRCRPCNNEPLIQ